MLKQDQEAIQAADTLQSLTRSEAGNKGEVFIHESDDESKKLKSTESLSDKTDKTEEKNVSKDTSQEQ